jgi:hypothetical protein
VSSYPPGPPRPAEPTHPRADDRTPVDDPARDWHPSPRRHARAPLAIAGAVAALLLVAACSGATPSNGVVTLETPGASNTPDPSGATGDKGAADDYDKMLAYAQCMRDHGVASFPDPVSDGQGHIGLQLQAGPGTGLDPNSATFKAADDACKSLMPAPPAGGNDANDDQAFQDMLAYSQCMRDNGVADFPDPVRESNGGVSMSLGGGPGSDLDPSSPTFQKAQTTCQSKLPGGPGFMSNGSGPGSGGSTGGGASSGTSGSTQP